MITREGYSKDLNIVPEGIAVTFGKELVEKYDSVKNLLQEFQWCMKQDDSVWHHKCRNKPSHEKELLHVYIIVLNRLYGRCLYAGYEKETGNPFPWPRILLVGPLEKTPFTRELRGFRGFRYTTKLF